MPKSINRKLAEVLVPSTTALKESVLDDISAGVTPYATLDDLPTSNLTLGDQAFVTSNQRLYLSNGSGWYNVAMFNATPNLTISPSGAITLATDGSTPTVITLTGTDSDNADANLVYTAESDGSFGGLATLSQDSSVFTITPLAEGSATTTVSTLTFKVSDGISFGSGTTEFSLTFGPDWSSSTESKILSSDIQGGDNFGAVSISADGNYAIVGAYGEDTGGSSAGSAYIFTRSGSTWTQQQKIQASDAQGSDLFCISVSISSDGSYAIVGAYLEAGGTGDPLSNAGAAYIFTRSGSTWTQQAKITASDAQTNDQFGYSVSINGDGTYVIVGASLEDGGANDPISNAGAAYIFTRSGSTWTQQQKIQASDVAGSDFFGSSMSMSSDGTYVIVGAYNKNSQGAAYVFTRSGSTRTQQAKLESSDLQAQDNFGRQTAINSDGSYVIVGAQNEDTGGGNAGAAYIFTRSGSTWAEQAKLTASDAQADDIFGNSVSINSDGSYAIVTSAGEDGGAGDPISSAGAAYIFNRSGSTWTEQVILRASDAAVDDFFGTSVSMNSDATYVIVGARGDDNIGGVDAGAAYIFEAGQEITLVQKVQHTSMKQVNKLIL